MPREVASRGWRQGGRSGGDGRGRGPSADQHERGRRGDQRPASEGAGRGRRQAPPTREGSQGSEPDERAGRGRGDRGRSTRGDEGHRDFERREGRHDEHQRLREDENEALIYGRRPVLEALRAGRPFNRLYVLDNAIGGAAEIFRMARDLEIPVVHSDRARLERLARGGNHQGVVAQLATREFVSLQELFEGLAGSSRPPLLLALDQVQDPHNLGALIRTAEAAGCQGLLLSTRGSCGLTAAVSRASAGADQFLPVARCEKLERVLQDCARSGYQVVGADPRGPSLFGQVNLTGPTVLVLGAEGEGMRPAVAAACTHRLSLPMLGRIESLNVSVSGALFLYEVVRQRFLN
ncbi:23S rRNA (guanosine(2251)-2'-O)-methyltransferase RlmB [bacterium CPR1]|nr:23S rRNA (guanosine(2251)-2'-O)-methyltransferase RlmB [bacterium CPR1]